MQMLTKRLSAVVLMACLLAALAFGGTAWAAGSWWTGDNNTLTVESTNNPDLVDDLAKANVVVDVIKVASATARDDHETFDYEFIGDYSGLSLPADPKASDWRKLAEDAAAIAKTTEDGTAAAGAPITKLEDGLYLVLGHGKGITDGLHAYSDLYKYTFEPAIVALPSKEPDDDGVIRTDDDYGPWLDTITVSLKSDRELAYGSIKITKTVIDFWGDEEATFAYHLQGTTPSGDEYDNYASITWPDQKETIVTHIPAGTVLTVTEIDPGPRYQLVSGDTSEKIIIADAAISENNPMPEAAFVNKPNGSGKGGHGIENNFKLEPKPGEGESAWDWTWTATPAQPVQDDSESQG